MFEKIKYFIEKF
jgi:hypothetical protein